MKKFHIEKLGYFGSFVQWNYTEESDIDILVQFNKHKG
ncbi:MAG: hypothetical protein EPN82_00410 [Bacteroidetes bacterium]|nr:MAG: hypothetical protein EPN82_00410 [Bacteroidota bacterium]